MLRPRMVPEGHFTGKIDDHFTAEDIHAEWMANHHDLCTTMNGYHPPKHVWESIQNQPEYEEDQDEPTEHGPGPNDNESAPAPEEDFTEVELTPLGVARPGSPASVVIDEGEYEELADYGGDAPELVSVNVPRNDSHFITAVSPSAL